MKPWLEVALDRLAEKGPMEIYALVDAALRIKRVTTPRSQLALRIYRMAVHHERGVFISEHPAYRLKTVKRPDRLHYYFVPNIAYKVLSAVPQEALDAAGICRRAQAMGLKTFDELVAYQALTDSRFVRLFAVKGRLVVGIRAVARGDRRPSISRSRATRPSATAPTAPSGLARSAYEAMVEKTLAANLDTVEPGLSLLDRQRPAGEVGRMDLLCKARNGNLVVIEVKRLAASAEDAVKQVLAYMVWIIENLARPGQTVRGVIVGGKPTSKLLYAIRAVPGLSFMDFDMTLRDCTALAPREKSQ